MKPTAEHIIRAVGRRVNWQQGLLIHEAVVNYVDGYNAKWNYETGGTYLADMMWVTRSGYATEFEIKVSRADWRADKQKDKWGYMPPWVSRFVYVVPEELGIPDFVIPDAGVWHYRASKHSHSEITVVRAPKRIGQQKVPGEVQERWLSHIYSRYWYQRLHRDARLPRASIAEAA